MTRTVLVVGGAGGIGFASARALADSDTRVVIADLAGRRLDDAGSRLADEGFDVATEPIDITDENSVRQTVERVAQRFGIYGLVNAAGIFQMGTVLDLDETSWNQVLDVNLTGVFRTCRAAIPMMRASGGGVIVNISSQSGRTKSFYTAPNYVASKAGVIGLTLAIAAQHAADGIRANAVAPGLVETAMIRNAYTDEQRASMIAQTPIGRFADPDEIARVVRFLASDEASYITGQTVNVNGGSFML